MKKYIFGFFFFVFVFVSCRFKADDEVKVQGISFSEKRLELSVGESKSVSFNIIPSDASQRNVSYSLSGPEVCSLSGETDSGCVIKALKEGSSILIAELSGLNCYLEISVSSELCVSEPYIVLPFLNLEIEKGRRKSVIASLYGGSESDSKGFIFESKSSNISIESSGNTCVIEARSSGLAKVVVSHPKASVSASFLVIVPDVTKSLFYLTTDKNYISLDLSSQNLKSFDVGIIGGTESDLLGLKFEVTEGFEFIDIVSNKDSCSVYAKKAGLSKIRVSHSKASEDLEILVSVKTGGSYFYISSDTSFLLFNDKTKKDISFNIPGLFLSEYEDLFEYENENPLVVGITKKGNILDFEPLKNGKSKITVRNAKSDIDKEILVVVDFDEYVSIGKYIEVSESIIRLEEGDRDYLLDVNLIGGTESDRNNFTWEISDGSVIEFLSSSGNISYSRSASSFSYINEKCYINARRTGKSSIKIKNPKAIEDITVQVLVYPKGTLEKKYRITGPSFIKVQEGEKVSCKFYSDYALNSNLYVFEFSDPEICSVYGTSLDIEVEGKKEGISLLKISHPDYSSTFTCPVICSSSFSQDSVPFFYFRESEITVSKNTVTFHEIQSDSGLDYSLFSCISDNEEVCRTNFSGKSLSIEALSKGSCNITVTHPDCPGEVFVLTVSVISDKISVEYPYELIGPKIISVIVGEDFFSNVLLSGALESEYNNVSVKNHDEDLCSVWFNHGELKLSGKKRGFGKLSISHSKVSEPLDIIFAVYENEEDLCNNYYLYSENTNYVISSGDSVSLSVFGVNEEMYDELIWNVSDLDLVSFNANKNRCFLTGNRKGLCTVTVSYPGSKYDVIFFILIEDSVVKEDYFYCPSIIELVKGERRKISLRNDGLNFTGTEWKSNDDSVIRLFSNDNDCYVEGMNEGITVIEVMNEYFSLSRKITAVVYENAEKRFEKYFLTFSDFEVRANVDEIKNISVSFGNNILCDEKIIETSWTASDENLFEVNGNGLNALVRGKKEGFGYVYVSNPYCENEVSIPVFISGNEGLSAYLSIDRIIKIQKGSSINKNFSLIDALTFEKIKNVSLNVSVSDESICEASVFDNFIHFVGKDIGECFITFEDPYNKVQATVLVSVYDEEERNVFYCEKDSFVSSVGRSFDINLVTSFTDEGKEELIRWECKDNCISLENGFGRSNTVMCNKEGEAVISVSYLDFSVCIRVFVSSMEKESGFLITENIVSVPVLGEYEIKYYASGSVHFESSCDVFEIIESSDSSIKIRGRRKGIGELLLSSGNESRTVVIAVNNGEVSLLHNLGKRNYVMRRGDIIEVHPKFSSDYDAFLISYNVSKNKDIALFDVKEGTLTVTAVSEGVFFVDVSYPGSNSYRIYFSISGGKEISEIEESSFFLISDSQDQVYIDGFGEHSFFMGYKGEGYFPGKDLFEVSCSDPELIDCFVNGSFCHITGKGKRGECYLSLSNLCCRNTVIIKVYVGERFVKVPSTEKYIYFKDNSFSFVEGETGEVNLLFNNFDDIDLNMLQIRCGENVSFEKEKKDGAVILKFNALSSGPGILKAEYEGYEVLLNYIVNEIKYSDTVYLTTSDNYISVKPGEYKTVRVSLLNSNNFDSGLYKWEIEDSSVCSLIGTGDSVNIYGIKEGKTYINISHKLSLNSLKLCVFVSKNETKAGYITTSSNVIETSVSEVLDSFKVSVLNSDRLESFHYEVSDKNILSLIPNGNVCYFRGLAAGVCSVTVSCPNDSEIIPISLTFIVEEKYSGEGYLSSEDKIVFLEPGSLNKTIFVKDENIKNFDSSKLEWYLYSEELSYSSSGKVISFTSNNERCVITPMNDGVARLRVVYTPLNIKLDILVNVSVCPRFNFPESYFEVVEGDLSFIELNIPTYLSDFENFIQYSADDSSVLRVFGSRKVLCIEGLKEGGTVVHAYNSIDGETSDLYVKVVSETEILNKIGVSENSIVLNPRSSQKRISCFLQGSGFTENDLDGFKWSISGNESLEIYPDIGPEVVLSIKEIDGKVREGNALITVTHPKCGDKYKKTILVNISENNNFFVLDRLSCEVDLNGIGDFSCSLIDGKNKDYDDVIWSVDKSTHDEDGNRVEVVRLLNTTGAKCSFIALESGTCYINCFYKGELLRACVTVKGNKYFNFSSTSLNLYPGEVFDLQYNLKPKESIPVWYQSDLDSYEKIFRILENDEYNQILRIEALNEGMATLTGMVSGVNSAVCNIRVEYNPSVNIVGSSSTFRLEMHDEGTDEYKADFNTKEVRFKLYPPIYQIKLKNSGVLSKDYEISYRQLEGNEVREDESNGSIFIHYLNATSSGPSGSGEDLIFEFYDKNNKKVNGLNLKINHKSYFTDQGYDVFFKRYDGNYSVQVSTNGDGLVPLNTTTTYGFGDGESHYIVLVPRHKNQYMENLSISSDYGEVTASEFNYENGVYTSFVSANSSHDVGWNCIYSNGSFTVPSGPESGFHDRIKMRPINYCVNGNTNYSFNQMVSFFVNSNNSSGKGYDHYRSEILSWGILNDWRCYSFRYVNLPNGFEIPLSCYGRNFKDDINDPDSGEDEHTKDKNVFKIWGETDWRMNLNKFFQIGTISGMPDYEELTGTEEIIQGYIATPGGLVPDVKTIYNYKHHYSVRSLSVSFASNEYQDFNDSLLENFKHDYISGIGKQYGKETVCYQDYKSQIYSDKSQLLSIGFKDGIFRRFPSSNESVEASRFFNIKINNRDYQFRFEIRDCYRKYGNLSSSGTLDGYHTDISNPLYESRY